MAVHMIERKSSGGESSELGVDLPSQLIPQIAFEEVTKTSRHWLITELALTIDQAGNVFVRNGGVPAQQREMNADTETRILSRELHRALACRLVHHQAGGSQNSIPVRRNDRLIDGVRTPEVIGIDDQPTGDHRADSMWWETTACQNPKSEAHRPSIRNSDFFRSLDFWIRISIPARKGSGTVGR